MQRIYFLFIFCLIPGLVYSSETKIIGGFVPDYKQWQSGYYVTVSHIDGKKIKGAYIKAKNQEILISGGLHKIKVSCAFVAKPKNNLVAQKEITIKINTNVIYKLTAIINLDKNIEFKNPKLGYCEPQIDKIKS